MKFRNLFISILLSPISLLYGVGVAIRNLLYNVGLLKSVKFDVPVISVGNLSVGGSGKTPHIEYLLRKFKDYLRIGVISRGYKRKSHGYLEIDPYHSILSTGDEPLQLKRKFRDVIVAVSESRSIGIMELLKHQDSLQLILMDDGFQHRSVRPGLNILLTDHHNLFTNDYLMPSGNLREWRSAYKRADAIIVSKCPNDLSIKEKKEIQDKIDPNSKQSIFFSGFKYGTPYYLFNGNVRKSLNESVEALVVCGIARPEYLEAYLQNKVGFTHSMKFEDHHHFSKYEVGRISKAYEDINKNKNAIVIMTEKDAVRIEEHRDFLIENKVPIFVLPVAVEFLFDDEIRFDNYIKEFLLEFKV